MDKEGSFTQISPKGNLLYHNDGIDHDVKPDVDFKYDTIVVGFEDKPIFTKPGIASVVVVRDIKNLVASRIKRGIKLDAVRKLYIGHCSDFFKSGVVGICFDKWFIDREYRRLLARKLGLTFTDEGINEIIGFGDSSFDGREYAEDAQEMNVLDRHTMISQHDLRANVSSQKINAFNKVLHGY